MSAIAAHPSYRCYPTLWDINILRQMRIPRYAVALLGALQFSNPQFHLLRSLNETEWCALLALCDTSQLTLLVGFLCRTALPGWVGERIDRNYLDYSYRFERLKAATLEIAGLLRQYSVDFTLLKGLTHSPALTPDPRLRAQGDIDLWCLPDRVARANDALLRLGYRPIAKAGGRHLDPMIREAEAEWRGDYFARDLPIPVDLHYKLWDGEMECIPGPREDDFWNRRTSISMGDIAVPILEPADALAFAALHVMMHLLHGDVRLQRVWELGFVLHAHSQEVSLWRRWKAWQPSPARRVQTIAFLLADYWFACGIPDVIQEEAEMLSSDVHLWLRHYGLSPIESLFAPNKSELWLNLSLVSSTAGKARVLFRRLLPAGAAKQNLLTQSTLKKALLRRFGYHARMLPVTCAQGCKWWWLRQRSGRD